MESITANATLEMLNGIGGMATLVSPLPEDVHEASKSDYLRVFDSRTRKLYDVPVSDGFVRGSDLSAITAPAAGGDGRLQKLAVLDPGFQHTACKESSITLM
jgi:hypothetical protein